MSGVWIKLQQTEIYMKARRRGYTQIVAAAKAGISERSGRAIEQGKRKDPWQKDRWRSCPDPLACSSGGLA